MGQKEPKLRISEMVKTFGPTVALNHVSVDFFAGEITGLIGENGSGKSTLSSIVAGVQPGDSGTMQLDGSPYCPQNMVDAQSRGVSMVVQEMGTVPGITVAENIFIGKENRFSRLGFVNKKMMNHEAEKVLEKIGVRDIAPDAPINSLSFEDKKLVELARAMCDTPSVLIIDETTTALSQRGRDLTYGVMRGVRDANGAVIFISHDLEELIDVCDSVTVLRDGQKTGSFDKTEMDPDRLRSLMVGRELTGTYYRDGNECSYGDEVVLEIKNLTAGKILENFSSQLHRGEILGVGGLTDCGMHDLGRAIFGMERHITGSVRLLPENLEINDPKVAIDHKLGYVSKNRDSEAVITSASILENVVLPSMDLLKNRLGWISPKKERKLAEVARDIMSIKCSSTDQLIRTLSGGNKQKVVFAKWLCNDTQIFILDCPTRGIDIGVKSTMYTLMEKLKDEGKSIILISEELPELIGMSDRLIILKDGCISGEFIRGKDMTEQQIIDFMI